MTLLVHVSSLVFFSLTLALSDLAVLTFCCNQQITVGEYRTALFIRESLLGKYHEQTGRTYFWIGKSLVKLDEFSEALVAFSRALRILERVVRQQHKYYKWTVLAIDNCIEQMNEAGIPTDGYKERLYASIKYEREGDTFRKQGKMAEAIAKYRDAISKCATSQRSESPSCVLAYLTRTNFLFFQAM